MTDELFHYIPEQIYGIDSILWIFIIAAIVIVLMIVFFIVYYQIYKYRINKALTEEKRPKRPLVSPGAVAVSVGIVVWVAVTLFIMSMLYLIMGVLAQVNEMTMQDVRNNAVYFTETAKEKLATDYRFKVGSKHPDTGTIDLTVSVDTALVLGKEDKLTFRVGDSKTELKAGADGWYSGTVQASVWKANPSGILTLESDGDRISQILSDSPRLFESEEEKQETVDGTEWMDMFPTLESAALNTSISKAENGKNRIRSELTVTAFPAKADSSNVFTELTLVFDEDGKVFRKVELTKEAAGQNAYTYQLNELVGTGEIDYYILAKDTKGNSYKLYRENEYILNADDYQPAQGDTSFASSNSTITDKDGKLLKAFSGYN